MTTTAAEWRGFASAVLVGVATALGIALIGVTQEAPGEGAPGRWHISDEAQAAYSTVTKVEEWPGPSHCDWQSVRLLYIEGSGFADIFLGQYVRDPAGALDGTHDLRPFLPLTTLPDDAERTGWSSGGRELWLSPTGEYAYLARGNVAEAWPRAEPLVVCS